MDFFFYSRIQSLIYLIFSSQQSTKRMYSYECGRVQIRITSIHLRQLRRHFISLSLSLSFVTLTIRIPNAYAKISADAQNKRKHIHIVYIRYSLIVPFELPEWEWVSDGSTCVNLFFVCVTDSAAVNATWWQLTSSIIEFWLFFYFVFFCAFTFC